MSARIVQPTRPGWRFWLSWMLATIAGAGAGLVLSMPLNEILVAALGTNVTIPWTATQTALIIVFKGAEGGMMGMGLGLGQWLVLRKYLKQTGWWVLATALVGVIQGMFRWSLPYDTPPWHVGVSTTLSMGVLFGFFQWFVLRGRVQNAGWWIVINIAGWASTLALLAAGPDIESFLGMVWMAVAFLLPFALAGGGMVWLLRQTARASLAAAS